MDAEAKDQTAPGASPAPAAPPPADEPPAAPSDAMHAARLHFEELREYVSYLIAAKIDGFKATAQKIGLLVGLGLVGGIIAIGFLITAIVLLLNGLAGGIGAMTNRPWLGDLIVGFVIVAGLGGGGLFVYSRFTRASRERTAKKYESLKRRQRERFGTDVATRAEETSE